MEHTHYQSFALFDFFFMQNCLCKNEEAMMVLKFFGEPREPLKFEENFNGNYEFLVWKFNCTSTVIKLL